ncbi:hypothetical protein XAPC_1182 [Xanthomonas citri pv. punicae str. LMG 859]|nr:hypothetical protein XAPC_1182 [Xanthomonas citri pv. punicae str. LMG 859]
MEIRQQPDAACVRSPVRSRSCARVGRHYPTRTAAIFMAHGLPCGAYRSRAKPMTSIVSIQGLSKTYAGGFQALK